VCMPECACMGLCVPVWRRRSAGVTVCESPSSQSIEALMTTSVWSSTTSCPKVTQAKTTTTTTTMIVRIRVPSTRRTRTSDHQQNSNDNHNNNEKKKQKKKNYNGEKGEAGVGHQRPNVPDLRKRRNVR
jgi:C4-dicarboxylate transporter